MHEVLELVGLGDEVGLAVDFDERAGHALGADVAVHDAFGGNAALLLGGGGKALLAQEVNRLFHIAIGGGERLFAIHHARAGTAAELHNHFCADFSHVAFLLKRVVAG